MCGGRGGVDIEAFPFISPLFSKSSPMRVRASLPGLVKLPKMNGQVPSAPGGYGIRSETLLPSLVLLQKERRLFVKFFLTQLPRIKAISAQM